MNKPILVVMAAGIGSRYGGGIKQLAQVGPSGELVIDYSVYDAKQAGFETVVFIIRRDIEEDFRRLIGDRVSGSMEVRYAFQDIRDLPDGFTCPEGRTKPWGTGHAVLSAEAQIDAPFAVINADDYYCKEAYRLIYDFLSRPEAPDTEYAMAGFVLKNTLSENGTVTRGVCLTDSTGRLTGIEETKEIGRRADGSVRGVYQGAEKQLDPEGLVSMNFWGYPQAFLARLKEGFTDFLAGGGAEDIRAEYLLPIFTDRLLTEGRASVSVLPTKDRWFGMTYQEDRQEVEDNFRRMVEKGIYPTPLF